MNNRWSVLALLFLVRTVMAFQFQTVAALSPFIEARYGVGLGAIGILFGLYMAPGLVLAIPGAGLARRFGEKRIVIIGLLLMAIGFAISALFSSWNVALAGRLIAGTGGILMNVIMTKMVADWFEGKEIATAMSIFIVSWPAGIALALVTLPPLAAITGLAFAYAVGSGLAFIAAGAFVLYRSPVATGGAAANGTLSRRTFVAAVATGSTWGFLNAALAVVFGFGVALLVARSVDVDIAGRVTSLTMIALAAIGPLGGIIADRTGRYMTLIASSLLAMAACLGLIALGASSIWLFILFGLACGVAAGPVMSLPGLYLPVAERSAGMGIFFTVYYLAILIAPPIAGWSSDATGVIEAGFWVGVVFCGLTLLSLVATAMTKSSKER